MTKIYIFWLNTILAVKEDLVLEKSTTETKKYLSTIQSRMDLSLCNFKQPSDSVRRSDFQFNLVNRCGTWLSDTPDEKFSIMISIKYKVIIHLFCLMFCTQFLYWQGPKLRLVHWWFVTLELLTYTTRLYNNSVSKFLIFQLTRLDLVMSLLWTDDKYYYCNAYLVSGRDSQY